LTGLYPNENGSLTNRLLASQKEHGQVKTGIPNRYQLLEKDWGSWQAGKQHFLTEDRQDESPASGTHWLSLDKSYKAFPRCAGP
jgi:hypothetical protein